MSSITSAKEDNPVQIPLQTESSPPTDPQNPLLPAETAPIPKETPPPAAETKEIELFHGVPISKLYEEYSSKEFRELESYMLGLEDSPKWHSLGSLNGVDGFKLSRSKFSSEIPVIRYVVHFSPPLPSEFVLNMFGDPSFRMSWDTRVVQMNKIYNSSENHFLHYHIVHFNAPLQDRDFLTKYYMRKVGAETRVVLKSTKHKVGGR